MHKSEPRANLTLKNHVIMLYELRVGITRPIGVMDPLKFNFEVDSTFHLRESTTFQYLCK